MFFRFWSRLELITRRFTLILRRYDRSNDGPIGSIDSIFEKMQKFENVTFGQIRPILAEFVGIGIGFERILERLAQLANNCHF